ncbi:uncharacterized protein LOC144102767 [Amblyomma americanum]
MTRLRVLVAGGSMLKEQAGSSTLGHSVDSGVRIERIFHMISEAVPGVRALVLHVGTNNLGETAMTRISRFRTLISRISKANHSIRLVISAILPRQKGLSKQGKWALTTDELEKCNADNGETNSMLQELCRIEGHVHLDGTRQSYASMFNGSGVHPNKCGVLESGEVYLSQMQMLERMLREAIQHLVSDLTSSHDNLVLREHQEQQQYEALQR